MPKYAKLPQAGTKTGAFRSNAEFTAAEHLRVQSEIEKLAYGFWESNGCHPHLAWHDWLRAEGEVLAEFIKCRMAPIRVRSALRQLEKHGQAAIRARKILEGSPDNLDLALTIPPNH